MPDGIFEAKIVVTDPKNRTHEEPFEYVSTAGDVKGCAEELKKAIVQNRGADRVRDVNGDR